MRSPNIHHHSYADYISSDHGGRFIIITDSLCAMYHTYSLLFYSSTYVNIMYI
jgi:hypothetical protein